ncbi:MAG: hypothetical protein EHM58_02600 [Ignavibacteriae bacterium]|nr:MAG: hypothetical protein EHM58_02600 [Ignavibacteriota bacterium]
MTDKEKFFGGDPSNFKFMTYDLGLASALVTLGYALWNLDKANIQKAQFLFIRDEHIDKMVNEYWDDKLMLPARSLIENQKMLKNRIYSSIE